MGRIDSDQFRRAVFSLMHACQSDDSVEFTGPLYGFIRSRLSRGLSRRMVSVGRFASSSGVRSDCSTGQVTVFTLKAYWNVKIEVGKYGVTAAYAYKRDLPQLLDFVTAVETAVRPRPPVKKPVVRSRRESAPVVLLRESYTVPDVPVLPCFG